MKQIDFLTSHFLIPKKILHQLIVFFFFALMPFSGNGQTTTPYCPNDPVPSSQGDLPKTDPGAFGSCTAKDIVIKEAFIDAGNPCNSCSPGTTLNADLILVVDNTQNSKRAMTVWADLVQTAPDGSSTICRVSRCFIPLKSSEEGIDSVQDVNTGNIMFTCGNALKLTNIVVAYSASGGGAVCPMTGFPPSKCDTTTADIDIIPPLNAIVTAECGNGNTGNYDLTVSGGVGDFSYLWSNGATSEDLTDVPLGAYTVIVTDNGNNDASGEPCTVTGGADFEGPCCEFTYNCPTFTPEPDVVECYTDIPTQTSYTEAEFEALGNGDGDIGDNPCGIVEITASNDSDPGCEGNVIRTFNITEYEDENGNEIRDPGEDNVLNQETCTHTYTIDYSGGLTAPPSTTSTVSCPSEATDPGAPADIIDACGRTVKAEFFGSETPPGCEGTVVWTYRYTACDLTTTADWTHTYTIDYTGGVTAPTDDTATVECPADATLPATPGTVQDACGRNVVPVYVGVTENPDPVTCEGSIEYKWSYTDCTGEVTDYYTYTYTIDYTGGVTAPTDDTATVECPADATLPVTPGTVQDACGRNVVPVYVGVTENPDPVTCEGSIEYKWSYTDCTGEVTDYYTYTYTIDYTGGVTAPTDDTATVECPADATLPVTPGTVQDACGRNVVPVYVGVTENPDPVTCEGSIEYKWSYTDCTGEVTDYYTYTYTIDYTGGVTAPTDDTATVECPADATLPVTPGTVQDACGRNVVPVYVGVTENPDPVTCEGSIEYKWSYTDCTGEVTDYYTYTYTIDYTGGVTAPTDDTATVECPADATLPVTPGTVQDACGRNVVPVYVGVTENPDPVTCEGSIEYKWSYTDCTGEVTDYYTYTYTIDYTGGVTAPTDDTATVECPADATLPVTPGTVQDACGRNVVPVYVGVTENPDPVTCEGSIEYKWSYTDCTGEVTDYYTYTYTIDYTGGVTAPTDDTATVECPADATLPVTPGTVQDACGRNVVPVYVGVTENPDPVTCEGSIEYKWSYTDCTGEVTDYYTYTYTIDYTGGVTAPTDDTATVECPADATLPVTPGTVQDACGRNVVPVYVGVTENPDPVTCEGSIEYKWSYTDCTGEVTDYYTYTYTIDYTGGVTAPTDDTATVECPADATLPATPGTVQDACGRNVVPVYVGVTENPDPVTCEGSIEYKWSYTDCTGEVTDYYTYTYTIDYTGGVTAPTDDTATVECPADATLPVTPGTVQDACGRNVVPVYVGVTENPDPVTCEGSIEYKWSYTDCTGEVTDYYTYTYTIDYTGGVTAPTDDTATVECPADATLPATPGTVQDACGRNVVPVYVGVTENPDPVTCEGSIEYKWSYTDCTGEVTDYYTYTYTIDYTGGVTAPTDDTATVECPADATLPATPGTVQDACGRNVVPVYVGVTENPDPVTCEGSIEYKWSYTDCTGEVTDYYTYTYTIDYTGGVTAPTDDTATVECPADATLPVTPGTVQDACGRNVVPVYVGVTENPDPVTCEGSIEYKWSYTDCTGEVTDYYTYTYTIDYTGGVTAPTDDTATVECPADATLPVTPGTVQDACGRNVVPVYVGVTENPDPVTCEGSIEYKWSYTDCTGEVTDYYTYTYTIDYTGGVTAPTDDTATVECPADATLPVTPGTVQDACGRNVVPVYVGVTENPDPVTCEGSIEYKWSYTDCTGEVTDYYTYTYTIDYTGGVTAPTDDTATVECPADATLPATPGTVQDACGRNVVPVYVGVTENPDPVTCEGSIEYKWSYTDCTGEVTDYYTYTYTIDYTGGVTAPTDDTATVECPADATLPVTPGTVQDACGRNVVPVYVGVTENPDPVTCEGSIEYKWSYTDCTGEVTDYYTYTYTIDYTGGVTAPTDDTATVECPADATLPATPGTVQDACGRNVVPVYVGVTENPDPVTCEGSIEYKWSYTDCTGEVTDYYTYTYTIDYTGGVTAPTDDTATVECPADATLPVTPGTVQDACGRNVVPVYVGVTENPDPVTCEGSIEYKWSYTDCTGEVTDYYTYTYTIDYTGGVTAPTDDTATVECPADATLPATPGTVQDACGRNVVPVYVGVTENPDPVTCEGSIEYKWSYTDCTGEVTDYYTYTYTVDDTVPPTITCPPTAVVVCGGSTHPDDTGNATATDNCDPNVTITYNDVTEPTTGCDTDTITRTWTATDCAGNSSTCTQNILVASVNIVKTFADDSVIAGGSGSSFTLVVTNDGSAPLSDVIITDGVDNRLAVTSINGPVGDNYVDNSSGQNIEYLIKSLAPGDSETITVYFSVESDVEEANGPEDEGEPGLNDAPAVSNTGRVDAVATDDPDIAVADDRDDSIDILVDIELEVVKTFVPSEIQVPQGTLQIFTIDVTNYGLSDAVDVAVTDMVNNILEVTAINVISGDGDCSASSGQDIACTVQIPSGDTVTIEVEYLSAPFFDDGGSPYGTNAGDDFYIIFLNGSVLEGSTDGGPVYLDGVDITNQITVENNLTRNEIIFDPPGDDPAFEMHLSCSDPFTGGWGQSAGPVEGVDVNWQIAYFSIGRYNSNRFIKSCGNVVNPFVIPNTAFADGEDSFGDEGDDDTATITIGPGITLDRLQTKGKRLTVRLTNFTGEPKEIADISLIWPNGNGDLTKVWLTNGNTSDVIWQGNLAFADVDSDPLTPELDSSVEGWTGIGTLLPGEAILRFDFQNKVANSGYVIRVNFTDFTWLDISVNGGVGATNTKTMEAITIEETAPTEETRMLISPNPATTSIEVKLEGYDRDFAEIMLFDLNGRQLLRVKEKYTPGEILVIELPTGLNEGLYYVKLNDRGSVKSVPLIISRPD